MTFSTFLQGMKWVFGVIGWAGGAILLVMLTVWGIAELIDYVRIKHPWYFKE